LLLSIILLTLSNFIVFRCHSLWVEDPRARELARSLEILGLHHRYLLWLVRLVESSTALAAAHPASAQLGLAAPVAYDVIHPRS
jgi:hypothetical protein